MDGRQFTGGPVPPMTDIRQAAAESKMVDAQKYLACIQVAQNVRSAKADKAINFLLLPVQDQSGVHRQEPEYAMDNPLGENCRLARAQAYKWLEQYFAADALQEQGVPLLVTDLMEMQIPTGAIAG